MYRIDETPNFSDPQDICLLLRAHGEQRWLTAEVLPVLRQLETPGAIPEDQLGAALAYLELLWLDAARRARETDATCAELDQTVPGHDRIFDQEARRYCAAVRRLRRTIGERVASRTRPAGGPLGHEHASH